MRSPSLCAGALLLVAGCGTHPPPAPSRPVSVQGVYSCALSVLLADGWEVDREYQGTDQDFRGASLRGVSGDTQYYIAWAYLQVRRTGEGEIRLQVRRGPYANVAWDDQMKQRITSRCMS